MEIKTFNKVDIDDTLYIYNSLKPSYKAIKVKAISTIGEFWKGTCVAEDGELMKISSTKNADRTFYYGDLVFTSKEAFKIHLEEEMVKAKGRYMVLKDIYNENFNTPPEYVGQTPIGKLLIIDNKLNIIELD